MILAVVVITVVHGAPKHPPPHHTHHHNCSTTTTTLPSPLSSLSLSSTSSSSPRQLNPSIISNINLLVILVRFSDHTSDRTLPPKSHFESLCTNNMIPYLQQQSYQLYTIAKCTVYDWITTDNTESYYSYNTGSLVGSDQASGMFLPVLRQLDGSGQIDFSQFDNDLDLTIDALLVIHSGYASEQGVGSQCGANPPQNRIVSQGHYSSNPSVWTSNNGLYNIGGYAIASAYDRVCPETATWATYGVMTHEFIHTFNTPDLYDIALRSSGTTNFLGGIATYDLMSNPFGPSDDGNGGGLSSCIKERIGWVSPIVIEYDGTYSLRPFHDSGDVLKITKGYGVDTEYLLIEYRTKTGYDSALPGSGLLIYHVDRSLTQQDRAGHPSQSGWPQNGNHYMCALLQADGKYDLEQGFNDGDSGDYYVPGMTLSPGSSVYPNTDSYQNGIIVSTGITITDIVLSSSSDGMNFRISGLGNDPNGGGGTTTTTTPPSTSPPIVIPSTPAPISVTTPAPVTNAPVSNAPITNAPVTNTPISNAPVTNVPVTVAPMTLRPTEVPPPVPTTYPTVGSIGITDDDNNGGGATASLEDLSIIPSTAPSSIPSLVPIFATSLSSVEPTFFSAKFDATSSAVPSSYMTQRRLMILIVVTTTVAIGMVVGWIPI